MNVDLLSRVIITHLENYAYKFGGFLTNTDIVKRILVIATGGEKNRSSAANYLRQALDKKAEFDFVDPRQIMLEVSSSIGHDKIYIRHSVNSDEKDYKRVYSKTYDAVIVRASKHLNYVSAIVRHLNENVKVFCTASGQGLLDASRKFVTHQIISRHGVRTPKTVLFSSPQDFQFLTEKVGGLPCVAKTAAGGSQGVGVLILETPLAASTALETLSNRNVPLILQEFIETSEKDSEKFDIRLIVVGNQVVSAMKRFSIKGDFRSNYTKSKNAEVIEPTEAQKAMAVSAAKALNLPFAGVDIAVNIKDGNSYVIEVNSNPGAGIIGITDHNHFVDLVDYVLLQAGKSVEIENCRFAEINPDGTGQTFMDEESDSDGGYWCDENKYFKNQEDEDEDGEEIGFDAMRQQPGRLTKAAISVEEELRLLVELDRSELEQRRKKFVDAVNASNNPKALEIAKRSLLAIETALSFH